MNNNAIIEFYFDEGSMQIGKIQGQDIFAGLLQLIDALNTSIATLLNQIQVGMECAVLALESLNMALIITTNELQNLIVILQEQHAGDQWQEWISLGVESLAVMVEMYSLYQTLLTLTGALTVSGYAHSAAWEVVNAVHTVSIALTNALSTAMAFLTSPIGLVIVAITALIAIVVLLVKNWDTVKAAAISVWETIQSAFSTAAAWFNENVVQPMAGFFSGLWDGFKAAAVSAWEGVKSVFSAVGGFFKDVFSSAWEKVVSVFSAAGNIFVNIKDAIVSVFKSVVNGIINGLNSIIAVPFKGINGALTLVKNIEILGLQPFSGLQTISVPQIPLLAQGAVLPANRPFMAIVGDQKHGTNIEAPLATIQEAVALVMQDQTAAIMAGFNTSVGVQREILQAVLGIQIGDDVIASAYDRYQTKLAVQRGG